MEYLTFVVSVFAGLTTSFPLNYCNLYPKIEDGDEVFDCDIPIDCTSGIIEWKVPVGYMRLTVYRLSGYSFCLRESFGTWLGNVQIVSSEIYHEPILMPLPDKLTCIRDSFGRAEMMVTANPITSDTVRVKYIIIPRDYS